MKEIKKNIDNAEKNAKSAQSVKVVEEAVDLFKNFSLKSVMVTELNAGSNTKVRIFVYTDTVKYIGASLFL